MINKNADPRIYSASVGCYILRELCPDDNHIYPVFEVLKSSQDSLTETHAVIKGMRADCPDDIVDFKNEVAVFKLAPHPHIIKCIQIIENVKLDFGKCAGKNYNLLLLPFLPTDLFECISKTPFDESIARYYLEQLLDAVEHLHKNGLAHRDIKVDNILIDDKYNFVLTDFGHTTEHSDAKGPKILSKITTPGICPPECFTRGEYKGIQMDMFAIGKLLVTMVIGYNPFQKATYDDSRFQYISEGKWQDYWKLLQRWMKKRDLTSQDLTRDFKELAQGLLNLDPERRFTIDQVRKSNWFKNTKPCALEIIQRKLQLAGVF